MTVINEAMARTFFLGEDGHAAKHLVERDEIETARGRTFQMTVMSRKTSGGAASSSSRPK